MKFATKFVCAVVLGSWAGGLLAQQPKSEPRTVVERVDRSAPEPKTRELDELLGIGGPFFSGFVDGEPLDFQQREKLLAVLGPMRRMGLRGLVRFSKSLRTIGPIGPKLDVPRGEVIIVRGIATYVVREQPKPELRERFHIDAWYRCQVVTYLGTELTVYTLAVPRAWPLATPMRQSTRTVAMLVKVLPPWADVPGLEVADGVDKRRSLLCVAPRLAWYPRSLLGGLGMDHALFDDVRDRAPLEERECFYRLLAAVGRAKDGQIEGAAREQLGQRRGLHERVARNPHQHSKERAAAKRALERADQDCDDVVPLFNDPAAQRGELFVLSGDALRAVEIRVDEPDVIKRFGIDHYYEIEVITPDSQNNPLVFCVAELPPDMPLGESIHQGVRIAGFFLKSWAFDSRKTAQSNAGSGEKKHQQLAPLLIAKTVSVLPAPATQPPSMLLPAVLAVLVVLAAALIWYVRRGDRRALAMASGDAATLPQQIALDPSPDASDGAASDDA